jgi:hypothetical protein
MEDGQERDDFPIIGQSKKRSNEDEIRGRCELREREYNEHPQGRKSEIGIQKMAQLAILW